MTQRRTWGLALAAALVGVVLPACSRRGKPAEVNPIVPSVKVNRAKAPLGSAIEVTYTWTVEPGARKLEHDHDAFVHFLDSHNVILFADSHPPTPPPSTWEPGKSYSYTLTHFVPVYPYVGEVDVRVGLFPAQGKRERPALKGDDAGFHEYRVAKMEFVPQTENIFMVYKQGWHNPETQPENPSVERTWTKKEALVSFKNPKKDVVVYLQGDTCVKCFPRTPELTVSIGNNVGIKFPVESPQVYLKKIKVKAADLGTDEWVDLRLAMDQSFIPKNLVPPLNGDERELGFDVYHLYVVEADQVGAVPELVDATPLGPAAPTAVASAAVGKSVRKK